MTDLDLGKEYRTVARALGMPWSEIEEVAFDGVEATWLDEGEKRSLRAQFERELAAGLRVAKPACSLGLREAAHEERGA